MKNLDKILGTVAVWGGAAGLSYMFNSFHFFSAAGAVGMVIVATALTGQIWDTRPKKT